MRGVSQASHAAVEEAFEPVLTAAGEEAAVLGEQMFGVVDLLDHSSALRRGLSNPARSPDDKARLAAQLLAGKVDDRVVEVVAALARHRWSVEADLTEALERLAAETVLASAQATGALERVEEELFRFDRFLVGERAVRVALTDRMSAPEPRAQLVRRLLDGKVHPVTLQLIERAALVPRGRTMTRSLTDLGRIAAHRRELLIAEVTAAVVPSKAQTDRLTSLLTEAYGRPVQLNVAVDPRVVGGMRVQVGDEVVDSTVLGRLEDVRRRLAG
jgi:F-type H+-transporting ATPase subunit delta